MKRPLLLSILGLMIIATTSAAEKLTIYTEEFPPFNFIENHQITGVSTEIVHRVMAATGIKYEIKCIPWEQAFNLAQKQANTLIFSISRSSKREALFRWIGILTPTTYAAMSLAARSDIKIQNLDDMKKYKIGTTKKDVVEPWLIDKGFSPSGLNRVSGENAALKNFKNLLNRQIDLWPFPDAVAYYIVRKEGHSNPESLLHKSYSIEELSSGYYIAASLGTSRAIISKISNSLKKFKQTDDYDKILAHWGVDAIRLKTQAPIAKLIYAFRNFNRVTAVGYLAADTVAAHRNGGLYRKEMRERFVEAYVTTFNQWCVKYNQMQKEVDALIIGDISGLKGWSRDAAREAVIAHTKIPSGCVLDNALDYAMIGFDKNDFIINMAIAKNSGQVIPKSYLDKAARVIE
jgi:polar amino acid transport system substrate-binding protein